MTVHRIIYFTSCKLNAKLCNWSEKPFNRIYFDIDTNYSVLSYSQNANNLLIYMDKVSDY